MIEIGHTFGFGKKVTRENTSERNLPLHDSNSEENTIVSNILLIKVIAKTSTIDHRSNN